MRVLITGVDGPSGRAVARMLLAAGHEVVGLAERRHRYLDPRVEFVAGDPTDPAALTRAISGCASAVHLAEADPAVTCTQARKAGARLVVPTVVGDAPPITEAGLDSAGADVLVVRTAPVAGRRADGISCRVLASLHRTGPSEHWQLLHTDDRERFLALAAIDDRTGEVELAAPGTVSRDQVREILRGADAPASVSHSRRLSRPARLDTTSAEAEWGFRCGWTAAEVVEDLARGLVGRRPRGAGAEQRRGRIPLPAHLIPSRVPLSDGRPLVTAAPAGLEGEFDDHIDDRYPVHTATNTSEALPGPMTPLTIDLQVGAIRLANEAMGTMIALDGPAMEQWTSRVVSVLGHHVYINASIGVVAAENMPGWDEDSIRKDAYGNIPADIRLQPHGKPPMPKGLAGAQATWTAVSRVIATARRYRESAELIHTASRAEALDAGGIAMLTDEQLHARALLWRDRLDQAWSAAAIGVMMTGAANAIHQRGKSGGDLGIDLSRLESARTMLAVERLAELCRVDAGLLEAAKAGDVAGARAASRKFSDALDAELAAIGHRGPGECELINPTFGDKPAMLVTAAAGAAQRNRPQRQAATGAMSRTARMAAGATVARERARDAVVRITHCLRLAVRERARRLVEAAVLGDVDDVFYLTLDEAFWPPADAADRVTRRKAEHARLRELRMPDVVVEQWQPVTGTAALAEGGTLSGIGVCPGVFEGPVKRVLSLDDDIEPGDVLVASVTDTGHTAMFAYAGAVVTDIGGAASHAAIVAREFGVPCIVDTKTATAGLSDGQIVRVDGAAGTLTVIADSAEPDVRVPAQEGDRH